MITTLQMELDLETDNARRERSEWQRAIDHNLHALPDYVQPDHLLIWQPGETGRNGHRAFDVQVSSTTACTCQRFKLWDRCPHVAFARRLVDSGHTVSTDTPVSAMEVS